MKKLNRDLRIDAQVQDAYNKAYIDSDTYTCNCVDKYECSTCNDTYDSDHNVPQPVAIARLDGRYELSLYQEDIENGLDIKLDMQGYEIVAI